MNRMWSAATGFMNIECDRLPQGWRT